VNSLLDVARRTYTESIDDVYQLVNQYAEEFEQPVTLKFSPSLGFHLSLTLSSSVDKIPAMFVNVTKKKNKATCTTLELVRTRPIPILNTTKPAPLSGLQMKYNDRINESLAEVYMMSNKVVEELVSEIRQQLGTLYKVAEALALLDMLVAFAHTASTYNYCLRIFLSSSKWCRQFLNFRFFSHSSSKARIHPDALHSPRKAPHFGGHLPGGVYPE